MENNSNKTNDNYNQLNLVPLKSLHDKNKELLIKLLKEQLDTKLCRLEKKQKNYDTIMKLTKKEVKNITEWSINANKQIKEKIKKDKEKQIFQLKRSKSKKKEIITIFGKTSRLKAKTPLRSRNTKPFILQNTKTEINKNPKNKSLFNSKTVKTLGNRAKSLSNLVRDKRKLNANNNKNQNNLKLLKSPSVLSIKSNKSNKTNLIKSKKNITKINNKSITPVRKKTPFKKRISPSDKAESIHSKEKENIGTSETIKKNEQSIMDIEELNLNKMESALQKEDLLNNNDPLLVSPITDSDFFHNRRISSTNIVISDFENMHAFNFNLEKNIDDKIYSTISDYLNNDDLIQFKNISKSFHKLFNIYIINKLEKEKLFFVNKKNWFYKNELPPKLSLDDFTLSKGGMKAIKLLNEPSLNHLFNEDSIPNDDRLIIYRIFFQLINHPYKNIPKDKKEEFWKKCQNYFSHENNGKTGEILQKIVDEKMINIEGDNLFKIYKMTENNLNKIYPNYYSKICGTTGLFTFLIKDILDFVGISNDQKVQNKAYWSYVKIIESIDNKIHYLKKLGNNKI